MTLSTACSVMYGRRAGLQEYLELLLQLGAGQTEAMLGFLNLEPIVQVIPQWDA